MLVAGVGVGVVNPPLASTAVGVVKPARAGMASGINSTFRQVGIATGIALLGSLFASKVSSDVRAAVPKVPGLSGQAAQITNAVRSGDVRQPITHLPAHARGQVAMITRAAFTAGLDRIMLVAAVTAFAAGALSFALIRSKDFAVRNGR
jgi:hypothetical protein